MSSLTWESWKNTWLISLYCIYFIYTVKHLFLFGTECTKGLLMASIVIYSDTAFITSCWFSSLTLVLHLRLSCSTSKDHRIVPCDSPEWVMRLFSHLLDTELEIWDEPSSSSLLCNVHKALCHLKQRSNDPYCRLCNVFWGFLLPCLGTLNAIGCWFCLLSLFLNQCLSFPPLLLFFPLYI